MYQLGAAADEAEDYCIRKTFHDAAPRFNACNLPGAAKDAYCGFEDNYIKFWLYEFFRFDLGLFLARPFVWIVSQLVALNLMNNKLVNKYVRKIKFLQRARDKMIMFNDNYQWFLEQRWRFDTSNVKALYQTLDDESKKHWHFDVSKVDLPDYAVVVAIACMRKWHEYKQKKKELAKKQFADKHAAHTEAALLKKRQDDGKSWRMIFSVLRGLGASFGGIGSQEGVAYPFVASISVSFALLFLFFYVLP